MLFLKTCKDNTFYISYTNKFTVKNILVTNTHGKKIKWRITIHLGEGNLICCTCPADPNFWQIKIIIIIIIIMWIIIIIMWIIIIIIIIIIMWIIIIIIIIIISNGNNNDFTHILPVQQKNNLPLPYFIFCVNFSNFQLCN